MSAMITEAPARASSLQVASPMPLAPPVTRACLPSRRKDSEPEFIREKAFPYTLRGLCRDAGDHPRVLGLTPSKSLERYAASTAFMVSSASSTRVGRTEL